MNVQQPHHIRYQGPFPCKGDISDVINPNTNSMSPQQRAWMEKNKPLYTGCTLTEALPHLPPELRTV